MVIVTGRRPFLIVAFLMLVINATVLSLSPAFVRPRTGDVETGDGLSSGGTARALIPKIPGDPNDGLGPPDEVYEDVEGPPAPDEKEED